MKTKRNRLVITLVSLAVLGLSAAGLQAQDATVDTSQLRDRLQAGQSMVRPELSEELQKLVAEFRAKRAELLATYRENRVEVKALIDDLRAKAENTELTEEERAAFRTQLMELKKTHHEEIRGIRQQLRDDMRAIRRQFKEEQGTTEG